MVSSPVPEKADSFRTPGEKILRLDDNMILSWHYVAKEQNTPYSNKIKRKNFCSIRFW